MHWFQVFLILHILAAMAAFGPDFAFPLIARMGQRNPRHGAFATEVIEQIERKMTIPLAVAIPLLGTRLIYTGHFDLWHSTWLVIAVIFYPVRLRVRAVRAAAERGEAVADDAGHGAGRAAPAPAG